MGRKNMQTIDVGDNTFGVGYWAYRRAYTIANRVICFTRASSAYVSYRINGKVFCLSDELIGEDNAISIDLYKDHKYSKKVIGQTIEVAFFSKNNINREFTSSCRYKNKTIAIEYEFSCGKYGNEIMFDRNASYMSEKEIVGIIEERLKKWVESIVTSHTEDGNDNIEDLKDEIMTIVENENNDSQIVFDKFEVLCK